MHFSFQATNGALLLHQKLTNIQLKDQIQFTKKTKEYPIIPFKDQTLPRISYIITKPPMIGGFAYRYVCWRDNTPPFSGSVPPNAGSVLKTHRLISFSF